MTRVEAIKTILALLMFGAACVIGLLTVLALFQLLVGVMP